MSKDLATLIEDARERFNQIETTSSHGRFLIDRSDLNNPKEDILLGINNMVTLMKVELEELIEICQEIKEGKFF